MPSIRKRIGYLPSINTQEIITKIATNENLSQSKVVGILVEEALIARGVFDYKNTNGLILKPRYNKNNRIDNSTSKYSDLDALISDNGITYNTNKYTSNSNSILSTPKEDYNEELFEQFKQFMLFQKMIQEK